MAYMYPYGDSQQLNLSWFLAKFKELYEYVMQLDPGESDMTAILSRFTEQYSTSKNYIPGDYCIFNGYIYKANRSTSGNFDSGAWDPALPVNDVQGLRILLGGLSEDLTALEQNAVTNTQYTPGAATADGLLRQTKNGTAETVMTVDKEPTRNSQNPVKSGSVYGELSEIKGSLNTEQTSRQNIDTAIQSALAYVETNFQSASRTYSVGEYFYSTTYNRLYRVTVATPQGTSFENHVTWISPGGFNALTKHSNQSVASGITGITTNILDDWLVRLAFYITSPIEVAAGNLTIIGNLPESLRPAVNQSYLLVYAKANNAPIVAGVRVSTNGDLLIYNIGGSAITYQSIQGICYYPII